jgi:Ca2+-binding RTX toxin-like protein
MGMRGNDTLNGGAGADSLLGGDDNDVLDGSIGDGSIYDGANDTLRGGDGDDRLIYSQSTTGVSGNIFDGGAGLDTFELRIGGRSVNLAAGEFQVSGLQRGLIFDVENIDIVENSSSGIGNDGANLITATGAFANSLIGNGGNDTIDGGGENDTINGGAGADRMVGGLGDDTYTVDDVGDVVVELVGEGTDHVDASISVVLRDLSQHLETLTLLGGANIDGTGNGQDNTITGNSGNNLLDGAWGDDTLIGGGGNDELIGGLGSDVFVFGPGHGADTISDFDATDQDELIDLTAFGTGTTVTNVQQWSDVLVTTPDGTILLQDVDIAHVGNEDFIFA